MSPEARPGILRVDKPPGPTSHDVVAAARKALGIGRIGHTGTLDPFASGLLLLCLGPATRLSEYFTGEEKEYVATARLGETTETLDPEGEVVEAGSGWRKLERSAVEEALSAFVGEIDQVPPRYSAKWVGGERSYDLARRGRGEAPEAVRVRIREIELLDAPLPEVRFRVVCSTGTYIRALARDLGESLGCGAYLAALRRTRIGGHRVEDAVPMDRLDDAGAVAEARLSPAAALPGLPTVAVSRDEAYRLSTGQRIPLPGDAPAGTGEGGGADGAPAPVLALEGEELVAVCELRDGELQPRKVLSRV